MSVRPAKTQISLGDSDQPGHPASLIRVFAVRMKKAWALATHWAHSEDSDQTGRIPRLIWVFAGRTCHFVGFVTMRRKSTYAKVHGSVSVDALQRKEAEESACGKVHEPAFKIT